MKKSFFASVFLCLTLGSHAYAGICEIKVVRTACPGKEVDSYKKCAGKPECSSKKKAATAEECSQLAAKECENSRMDITKSKVITATFGGQDLKGPAAGGSFCEDSRPDFNKCK